MRRGASLPSLLGWGVRTASSSYDTYLILLSTPYPRREPTPGSRSSTPSSLPPLIPASPMSPTASVRARFTALYNQQYAADAAAEASRQNEVRASASAQGLLVRSFATVPVIR